MSPNRPKAGHNLFVGFAGFLHFDELINLQQCDINTEASI